VGFSFTKLVREYPLNWKVIYAECQVEMLYMKVTVVYEYKHQTFLIYI